MEFSPAVEVIWNLAANEAVAAQMREIEPEHFFCALLKFCDLENAELEKLAPTPLAVKGLIAERDRLRSLLSARSLSSTDLRRQLRQTLGQGTYQHQGGEIHRSEASRQLFAQASQALPRQGVLESVALLQLLLDKPTPALAKVIGGRKGSPPPATVPPPPPPPAPAGATPPPPEAGTLLLDLYGRNLSEEVKTGSPTTPPWIAPQVKVLSWAVQAADAMDLLVICEPPVDLAMVLKGLAQELGGKKVVGLFDLGAVFSAARDDARLFSSLIGRLLTEANVKDLVLFLDGRSLLVSDIARLMPALRPAFATPVPQLGVVVSVSLYQEAIQPDPELDDLLRPLWLHQLGEVGPLVEL